MVRKSISRLKKSDRGATAVEYGLVMALMVLAIIGGITALGTNTSGNFDSAAEGFPTDEASPE
ncbi:Flp family type IVb pilin [Henriciella sp.]|uniref:Flp family type IVb pilin n=1 Tax=Henriciella sp. TaxID=1968823 RepID=UPI00262F49D1|nr:Flp family type IVb pilin [Henriciella sp.]